MSIGLLTIMCLMAVAIAAGAEVDREAEQPSAEDRRWWRMVMNQAKDGQPATADIYVLGYIAADYWDAWLPDDTFPLQFANDLKALGNVEEIHLRINSMGGSVFSAYAISAMLRDHSARVVAHIDGVAASAATILALASANEVVMPANAMFLIHLPSMQGVSGNENDFRAVADELAKLKEGLVAVYEAKTGMGRDELISLMTKDSYITAKEAAEYGFVDTVASPIPVAACAKPGRYMINNSEIDFRGARVWPEAMLAEVSPAGDGGTENPNAEASESPEVGEDPAPGADDESASAGPLAEGSEPETELADDAEEIQPMTETTDAVAVERQRVADILSLQTPGAEDIISRAITDGSTAGDVAMAILKSSSVQNAGKLQAYRTDAAKLGAIGAEPDMPTPEAKRTGLIAAYKKLRGEH